MKEIKFVAINERTLEIETPPKPASSFLPKWFKDTAKYERPESSSTSLLDFAKTRNHESPYHTTFKMCQPFLDTMIFGYILTSPATVVVTQVPQPDGTTKPIIHWNTGYDIVDIQSPSVASKLPRPIGYSSDVFRWINNWKIKTPKGYSAFFTHPIYHYDLPFHTLTGIVDTDAHINPVIFPFFLREGFEGEIPVGTPIAQVIPFKQDNWKSEIKLEIQRFGTEAIKQGYQRVYKKLYWTRKQFL